MLFQRIGYGVCDRAPQQHAQNSMRPVYLDYQRAVLFTRERYNSRLFQASSFKTGVERLLIVAGIV